MASNPYFSPLHTQRFSFIGSPQQRDGTYLKDQRFLNMYPEMIKSPLTDGKKYYLKKRPGITGIATYPPGNAQGCIFWNGAFFAAVGGTLYMNETPTITLTQSNGPIGFAEFRSDADDFLVVCDGTKGWIVRANNTVTPITDPNFPSPHVPTPIFLDGYIFLASPNTQTIHNSTLQDPNSWPTDGFIDAEMYPDNIVALTKAQNYLVAIGGQSIEFFYDNANATGSPLQRNAPAVAQFGCPAPVSISQTEKEFILVGETGNGGRTIWVIDGFQPTEIANEPVREALDLEGAGISAATAFTIQCAGHKWYVLNLAINNRTFVYDFEEQMWHEWTSGSDQVQFQWFYSCDTPDGTPAILNATTGILGRLSPTAYTDLGETIHCEVVTSKIDFDTITRKRFFRLTLIGDSPNGDTNTPVTLNWSDDDYNTWTGGFTIPLNGNYPTVTQLGYSRRRAFQFIYQQPFSLRLESFEVDITQEIRR